MSRAPEVDEGAAPETTATGGPGRLTVIATPIGNLDDLSARARDALEAADLVACEDTRRSGRLLAHLGLKKRLVSLHDHNERRRLGPLLAALEEGRRVAVISDAGTPLLSDPGFLVVREAIARGIAVEAVPGASAALTALVVSGLPPYPYTFVGFPPRKGGKRRTFLGRFAGLDHTLILYESPHRIAATLADAVEILGDRPAALSRELTKLHEETLRGPLSQIAAEVDRRGGLKGELTLVVGAG